MTGLIDTHAHLNFSQFADDTIENILARAKAVGVQKVINVGADLTSSKDSVALASKHEAIYASVGIHPHDVMTVTDEHLKELAELSKSPKVVAIGETGLDYFKYDGDRQKQQDIFRAQLRLAKERALPVIIHDRDAHADVLAILKEFAPLKGVMHCFSGDVAFARSVLELGMLISFTGNITFPKAQNLRDVVAAIPLEKMMVETDCPFMAPVPYRGQRNEPAYVLEIAKKIAEVKDLALDDVARITTANAKTLFSL